jgi:hypothetical protein
MRRQPIGGHVQPVPRQARGHHPPTDRPLCPAERAQQKQPSGPAWRNLSGQRKADEPGSPDKPDQPAKLPMPPFPPIDRFERLKGHPLVLQLVFRDRLILLELRLPRGIIQRRQRAGDRPPFRDRQSRIRQPRQPPHRDHRCHQQKKRHEPQPDAPPRTLRPSVDPSACRRDRRLLVRPDLFENAALRGHPLTLLPWAGH